MRISDWSSDVCSSDLRIEFTEVDTVEPDRTGADVVETLQQLKHRGLAGTAGANQRHRLALADVERHAIERWRQRPRRIVERNLVELQTCLLRFRQRAGLRRWRNLRRGAQQIGRAHV